MGMRVYSEWDLIWHCLDCLALVGTHEGTDIPLGYMADRDTRDARYQAHKVFDPMWRRRKMSKADAYIWMASVLGLPLAEAHIGMLDYEQCHRLIAAVNQLQHQRRHPGHWTQKKRKRRRN